MSNFYNQCCVGNGIFIDFGHENLSIASVTAKDNKYNVVKYEHYNLGSSDFDIAIDQYITDFFQNYRTKSIKTADEKTKFERAIQEIMPPNPLNPIYVKFVREFKEKIASMITVKMDTYFIPFIFDSNITISGKEFMDLDISSRIFDFVIKLIEPYNDGTKYDFIEVQGGVGASEPLRKKISSIFQVTQRIHPFESICSGGIHFLMKKKDIYSFW